MKKFFLFCLLGFIGSAVLGSYAHVCAYPYGFPVPSLRINQEIYFDRGPGTTPGGEFKVYDAGTDDYLFNSFCLETNESLSFSGTFIVQGISDRAINGGSGGGSPDPLDERTAYLYHHFFWGTLEGYDGTDASANALQKAIWFFEEEKWGEENYFTGLAETAITSGGWSGLGDVRVLNLTDLSGRLRQDQLTIVAVPEPATMLLFGVGLIGLAGIGRKKLFRRR